MERQACEVQMRRGNVKRVFIVSVDYLEVTDVVARSSKGKMRLLPRFIPVEQLRESGRH